MSTRSIGKGETLGPNPEGRKVWQLRKGHAAAVEGMDRKSAGDTLGGVHDKIISESERVARLKCPLSEQCEIFTTVVTSHDSYPSGAVFECPREGEECGDITLGAAQDADRQIFQANRLAAEAIMNLGPS